MSNSRLVSCGNAPSGRTPAHLRQRGDALGERVVEHHVAGGNGAQRVLDPLRTGALDEVTAGAIAQCGQRVVEVFRHRQHHHPHVRPVLGEPPVDLEAGRVGQSHVEQQHGGRHRLDELRHLVGALRFADELDAVHLLDGRGQPQTEHRMVVDDGDADGPVWSVTAAPPEAEHGCGCREATCGVTWTLPPSSVARSRIAAHPTPTRHPLHNADPVVDDVDVDGRAS